MTSDPAEKPAIVLVHGAWADGSSWQRVIPLLLDKGYKVVAVQNPTTSLADDVAAVRRTLAAIAGPVVLAGHSWGGAVITEAGTDPKVRALVYVAAFAPAAGDSVGGQVQAFDAPPALAHILDDGAGNLTLSEEGWITGVAQDLPETEARVLATLQPPLPASTFGETVTVPAWANTPSWYAISTLDRTVSVVLQRKLAAAIGATTVEVEAGHLSLLSQPEAIAALILDAAAAVG